MSAMDGRDGLLQNDGQRQQEVLESADVGETPNGASLGGPVHDAGIVGDAPAGKYVEMRGSIVASRDIAAERARLGAFHEEISALAEEGAQEPDANAEVVGKLLARVRESFNLAESAVLLPPGEAELCTKIAIDLAEVKEEVARLQSLVDQGQVVPRSRLVEVGFAVIRIAICVFAGAGIGPVISMTVDGEILTRTLEGALSGGAGGFANEAASCLMNRRQSNDVRASSQRTRTVSYRL